MNPDGEISKDVLKNVNTKGLFTDRSTVKITGVRSEFGPDKNVPLPGVSGVRAATNNNFGYDPLNYFYQLADYVHRSQPTLVSFVRISVGSNYNYAFNNYSQFYGSGYESGCQELNVVAWSCDNSYCGAGIKSTILRGPAENAEYVREAAHQVRIKFRTYQGYQDASAIIAVRQDSGSANQRQFWIMGDSRQCGAATAQSNFGWVNLTTSARTFNQLTYDETPVGTSNQVVTTNMINYQQ